MTERWVAQSKELLKALTELASKKEEDRLEMVNTMMFVLNSMDRSLHGWRSWIQNLSLMSKFTEEELRQMREGLLQKAQEFINYDMQITEKHKDKIPSIVVVRKRSEEGPETGIYA